MSEINLTPLDIKSHTFKKKLRGYCVTEVNALMNVVAKRLEDALFENKRLEEKVGSLTEETKTLHEKETLLEKTLVSAQNAVETMKDNARAECSLMKKETEDEVARIRSESQQDLVRVRTQYHELEQSYIQLRQQIRLLLENFIAQLDSDSNTNIPPH